MSLNIAGDWERGNVWKPWEAINCNYIYQSKRRYLSVLFFFFSQYRVKNSYAKAPRMSLITVSLCSSSYIDCKERKSGQSGETEIAYQSVPSTSNTIPFSGGALWGFPLTGSKGANRFAGLRVASAVILRFRR